MPHHRGDIIMKCCTKERRSRFSGFRCFRKCADRYPRFVSIICGIVLPLFLLDAFCIGMGRWIAALEAPQEIINNNALLRAAAYKNFTANVISSITARAPETCLHFFLTNQTEYLPNLIVDVVDLFVEGDDDDFRARVEAFEQFQTDYLPHDDGNGTSSGDMVLVNITEAYQFLEICGDHFRNAVDGIRYQLALESDGLLIPDLTFSWSRCTPNQRDPKVPSFADPQFEISLRPPNQQEYFTQLWLEDQVEIYEDVLETLAQNLSYPLARLLAFENSTQLATGGTGCAENTSSSAWFWFTVMSTVGYGNMAANTPETRSLVFTLGLLSILAFGGVLATAGYIISTIFDDAFRRLRLEFLTIPWVAAIFWGSMYYGWMGVIMVQYYYWNKTRLGEEGMVSYSESYWFSYISTTTVGLGDYVLLPDVMLPVDIVTWPLSFLVGFVFFAAFIGKMGETFVSPLQSQGINLGKRLETEHPIGSTLFVAGSGAENAPLESTEDDVGEPKKIEKSFEEDKPWDDPIDEEQLNVSGDRSVDFSLENQQAERAAVEQSPGNDEPSLATGTELSVVSVKMESLAKGYVD